MYELWIFKLKLGKGVTHGHNAMMCVFSTNEKSKEMEFQV